MYISLEYAHEWKCLAIRYAYIQLYYANFKEKLFIILLLCIVRHLLFCGFSYCDNVFVIVKKEATHFL